MVQFLMIKSQQRPYGTTALAQEMGDLISQQAAAEQDRGRLG